MLQLTLGKGLQPMVNTVAIELTGENKRQLFVPRGFAHGFLVLSDSAIFAYKVDNTYAPEYDAGIRYDDKELNINWGITEEEIQLSEKDKNLSFFKDLDSPFKFKYEYISYRV